MNNSAAIRSLLLGLTMSAFAVAPVSALADSGFYIGASAGGATLEADLGADPDFPELPSSIDEDDTAFKAFLGYHFDLPVINLGIEAGYVDFGEPDISVLDDSFTLDTSGLNVWGIAGFDVGPIDLFAKFGYLMWDVEAALNGQKILSDDGSDMGYGVGIGFGLGPVQVRGEYEVYDLDEADLTMLSIGLVYQFN